MPVLASKYFFQYLLGLLLTPCPVVYNFMLSSVTCFHPFYLHDFPPLHTLMRLGTMPVAA